MATIYPTNIDNNITLPQAVDLITPVQAEVVNRLRDAIIAIEAELGIDPSREYATVRARLDALEGGGGGGGSVDVYHEGTLVVPTVEIINFTGSVNVTSLPNYEAVVDIIGAEQRQESFVGTAGQLAFTLSEQPLDATAVQMFINGAKQRYGFDYTAVGTSVSYLSGDYTIQNGDIVEFWYVVNGIFGGGGSSDGYITIIDESTVVSSTVNTLRFIGDGVVATDAGGTVVDITIVGEQSLSEVLAVGNTTDGYDIEFTSGDNILLNGDFSLSYPDSGSGSITVNSQSSTTASSGAINIHTGTPAATFKGGNISLLTQSGGGYSGDIFVVSGPGSGSGRSGAITVNTGVGSASGSGDISVFSGEGQGNTSGNLALYTGLCGGSNSGSVNLYSGQSSAVSGEVKVYTGISSGGAASGVLDLYSGNNLAAGVSGAVSLHSGTANVGNTGNASIYTGTSTSSNSGVIAMYTGDGVSATSETGSISIYTGGNFNAANTDITGGIFINTGDNLSVNPAASSGSIVLETGSSAGGSGGIFLTAKSGAVSSGNITLSTNLDGDVNLRTDLGDINLRTGIATGVNIGLINLEGGNGSVTGGPIRLYGGPATGVGGTGGSLYLWGGEASNGIGGEIQIYAGLSGNGNRGGDVLIQPGPGDTQSLYGQFRIGQDPQVDANTQIIIDVADGYTLFQAYGDGYFDGDLEVTGKLTVGGLIDPTGLVLVEQASVPGGNPISGSSTLWIRSSDNYPILTDSSGSEIVIGAQTLAQTLALGNSTGGTSVNFTSGDNVTMAGNFSMTSAAGTGASITLTSGSSTTGFGGDINLNAAGSTNPGSKSGRVILSTANDFGLGDGTGDINAFTGAANSGITGALSFSTGSSSGTSTASGGVQIKSGDSSSATATNSGIVNIFTGNLSNAGNTGDTGYVLLHTGNNSSTNVAADSGAVTIYSGNTNAAGGVSGDVSIYSGSGNSSGDVYISSGDSDSATGSSGTLTLKTGVGGGTNPGASGDINISTTGAYSSGDISLTCGASTGAAGGISITGGTSSGIAGGSINITAGSSGAGVGGDLSLYAGNSGGANIGGDILLKIGLSGAGNGHVKIGIDPTLGTNNSLFQTYGDGYFDGDVEITGKLTVAGLIDPIGLVLDVQPTVPGGTPAAGKSTLWIRDSDGYVVVTDEFGGDLILSGGGSGSQTLSQTLALGNATGGSDIILSTGDSIIDSVAGTDVGISFTNNTITNKAVSNIICTIGTSPTTEVGANYLQITRTNGQLRLQGISSDRYLAIQADPTQAAAYTLTFPATQGAANQTLSNNGAGVLSWSALGNVVGPASATDHAIARFDLTTGKLIQNSAATISDTGLLTAVFASGAAPASSGALRLSNTDVITARNATNNGNLSIAYTDSSNNLVFGDSSAVATFVWGDSVRIRADAGTDRVIVTDTNTTFNYGTNDVIVGDNYISVGGTPSTAGSIRLSGSGALQCRNAANDGNVSIAAYAAGDNSIRIGMDSITPLIYIGSTTTIQNRIGSNNRLTITDTNATFNYGTNDVIVGDGFISVGATPATTGAVRTSNAAGLSTKTAGGVDANLIYMASDDTIRIGMDAATTWIYLGAGATGSVVSRIGSNNRVTTVDATTTFNHGAGGDIVIGDEYISIGATPATAGSIRLPNNKTIQARNGTNAANVPLLSLTTDNYINIGDSAGGNPRVRSYATEQITHVVNGNLIASINATGVQISGGLDLVMYDADNTHYTAISPNATITGSYTLTLPPAQGGANQVLINSGTGALSWSDFLSTDPTLEEVLAAGNTTGNNNIVLSGTGILTSSEIDVNITPDDGYSVNIGDDTGVLLIDTTNGYVNINDENGVLVASFTDAGASITSGVISLTSDVGNISIISAGTIVNKAAANVVCTIGADPTTEVGAGYLQIVPTNGQLRLTGNSASRYLALQSDPTLTSSYTLIFPAAQGAADQILANDGAGALSWVDTIHTLATPVTDNAVVRWNTTTGKSVQESANAIIDDSGNMSLGTTPSTFGRIRIPNNNGIYARNQENTADISLISINTNNDIVVGSLGATGGDLYLYSGGAGNDIFSQGVFTGFSKTLNTKTVVPPRTDDGYVGDASMSATVVRSQERIFTGVSPFNGTGARTFDVVWDLTEYGFSGATKGVALVKFQIICTTIAGGSGALVVGSGEYYFQQYESPEGGSIETNTTTLTALTGVTVTDATSTITFTVDVPTESTDQDVSYCVKANILCHLKADYYTTPS